MKDNKKPLFYIEVWSYNNQKINFCDHTTTPMPITYLKKSLKHSKQNDIKTIAVWKIYPKECLTKYFVKSSKNNAIIFANSYNSAVVRFKKMYPNESVIDYTIIR